jgi:acyl-coenzyme A thioesterase PaaI-like protein
VSPGLPVTPSPPGVTLHPVPMRRRGDAGPPLLTARELAPDELSIVRHADQALERAATTGQPFLRHFWGLLPEAAPGGASCVMPNGPHVGNRVGYVQGGILFALGAATAMAALPETWRLLSAAAAFISPGQGPALKAQASIVHQGQRVAAIRTEVLRSDGRRVLEMLSTHTAIA